MPKIRWPDYCGRAECFACDPVRLKCEALTSTDFGEGRECPFFKPLAVYNRECRKYKEARESAKKEE